MALLPVQGNLLGEFPDGPVDPDADEAILLELSELLLEFALLSPDDRGEDLDPRPPGKGEGVLEDHVHRLGTDFPAALPAVGDADPGEEKPQVIVDLRDRPHGGAGVLAQAPLLDGDGRREALDGLHVGLVHLADELPGVGGKRLDVPPLTLGVDGVEGQGRLAGTAHPGDDDEPVPGNVHVDVFQVVLAGAPDPDDRHGFLPSGPGNGAGRRRAGPRRRNARR